MMDGNLPQTAASARTAVALPDDELIRVLQNSLYPGAKPESVKLVLAWCRATGRDPMKKPIHIVPMNVKIGQNKWEWRDVLMPGIGTYRSDAAGSGVYAGKDEPEFGPEVTRNIDGMEVTYPQWCRLTVYRLVGGQRVAFTAKEFWIENYAPGKGGMGVNDMWRRRGYGQLAKVAESQALRMAFPDETGNTNTSEEMEGKQFVGTTIEADMDHEQKAKAPASAKVEYIDVEPPETPVAPQQTASSPQPSYVERAERALLAEKNGTKWLKVLDEWLKQATSASDLADLERLDIYQMTYEAAPSLIRGQMEDKMAAASEKLSPMPAEPADMAPAWGGEEAPKSAVSDFQTFAMDEKGNVLLDERGAMVGFTNPFDFARWLVDAVRQSPAPRELRRRNAGAEEKVRQEHPPSRTILETLDDPDLVSACEFVEAMEKVTTKSAYDNLLGANHPARREWLQRMAKQRQEDILPMLEAAARRAEQRFQPASATP